LIISGTDSRVHPFRRSARPAAIVPLLVALLTVASTAVANEPAGVGVQRDPAVALRQEPRELVVLVHGMGRTSFSMLPLAWMLEREGYEVLNWGYSSLCCSVADLGARLQRDVEERRGATSRRVHFVGHSLGNIIIRSMLTRENAPEEVGRVVMLAPPNQGSHEADRHWRSVGWLLRPIAELRTDGASTVHRLPRVENVPIGVVAGRYDGKVSVEETHLPEERAHVVVPGSHSFLMLRGDVQELVVGFLRHASFPSVPGVAPAPH
jgi:triacylglycerol lipase